MARIVFIKLFTGLTIGPAQLSAQLQRAGHDSRIIYLKDYVIATPEDVRKGVYKTPDFPGYFMDRRGKRMVWNCYEPIQRIEYDLLFETIDELKPDLIGFSVNSPIISESAYVTAKLKEHFADIPIIWGGVGPTLEPQHCIELADLICINEGEEVIVELANRIDAGDDIATIPGTWVRGPTGKVIKNPGRALVNLDDIAIPDWEPSRCMHIGGNKLTQNYYPNEPNATSEFTDYPIMTQRGCPFSCSFCVESRYKELFGKKDSLRRRDPDLILEELRRAKEGLDIEIVYFWDDVFTVNPRWLSYFLPRYKQEIGLPFWCFTYPTTHNPEILRMMRDAGCVSMTMGVQSGSERTLRKHFNRPVDAQRAIDAAQEIINAGIDGYFDIITRVHLENEEDLRATFEFLLEFPREMKIFSLGDMINFPTYGYTRQVENAGSNTPNKDLTDDDYDYYSKLYFLTRTSLPREEVRSIGNDSKYRRNHRLLDPLIADSDSEESGGVTLSDSQKETGIVSSSEERAIQNQ